MCVVGPGIVLRKRGVCGRVEMRKLSRYRGQKLSYTSVIIHSFCPTARPGEVGHWVSYTSDLRLAIPILNPATSELIADDRFEYDFFYMVTLFL